MNDIRSMLGMVLRSLISPERSMYKIEFFWTEVLVFEPILMIDMLKTMAENKNTIIAKNTPTNEPHTTSKNFFIISLTILKEFDIQFVVWRRIWFL